MAEGIQVKVLVANVYNDPDHHALPMAKVGSIITVAAGGYFQSLREEGFVVPVDNTAEQAAIKSELADLANKMAVLETETQVLEEMEVESLVEPVKTANKPGRKPAKPPV